MQFHICENIQIGLLSNTLSNLNSFFSNKPFCIHYIKAQLIIDIFIYKICLCWCVID